MGQLEKESKNPLAVSLGVDEKSGSSDVLQRANVEVLVLGNVIDVLTRSKYLFRVTGRIRGR